MCSAGMRDVRSWRFMGNVLTLAPRVQGYTLIEYPTQKEAKAAIEGTNGKKLLDQTLTVDFAFVRPMEQKGQGKRAGTGGAGRKGGRGRSRSPGAPAEPKEEAG